MNPPSQTPVDARKRWLRKLAHILVDVALQDAADERRRRRLTTAPAGSRIRA